MTGKPPWFEFQVGEANDAFDCVPLRQVFHVAHIGSALSILSDGRIRPSLVSDKSKLNTHRILVSWVSPNDWSNAGGVRYGNVRFSFEWRDIYASRKAYWVESVAYGVEACRILLSDVDLDRAVTSLLTPYDPTSRTGPWFHDTSTDEHWWNGQYCLEIMVESELPISLCSRIDFVRHHDKRCCISPRGCRERGITGITAGARFLARAAAERVSLPRSLFCESANGAVVPNAMLKDAAGWLLLALARFTKRCTGPVTWRSTKARALGRAVLFSLACPDEARRLCSLFASREDMVHSVLALVADATGTRARDLRHGLTS